MASERRPHETGHHLLGPHVVGQRVVVRRLLRGEHGPTGGPAMTDVLGVCLAWGDGECVVQSGDDAAVRIPIADIVSGKPVPPRPSVRQRITVAEAEAHTARLWPQVETAALGAWTLRSRAAQTGRLVRRPNSCLAVGDPGRPLEDALAAVRAFYDARERPRLLHVEAGGDVERAVLDAGGTDAGGAADFRLASIARVRRTLRRGRPDDVPAADPTTAGDTVTVTVGDGCDPLAEGVGVLDGDWLGIRDLVVDPAHRRRGLATAVVAALLDWGAERGAMTTWLHVETDNTAGQRLYDALGFDHHHTMRYLELSS